MRIIRSGTIVLACFSALAATRADAASCRAQQIMASQCTCFALEELGGDRSAAKRAETLATSTPIDGCSPGQYQMVLLRGTGATQSAIDRLRARGARDVGSVQAECAAAAGRIASR
jgi:hypothetical protein